MSKNLVPGGHRAPEDISVYIDILRCLIPGKHAYYLAAPITTGKRLWDLAAKIRTDLPEFAMKSAPTKYIKEVFKPNLRDAKLSAFRVRQKFGPLVIDPSRFFRSPWSQDDYALFWEVIIRRLVKGVILSPGWEYSKGCIHECMLSLAQHIDLYEFPGTPTSGGRIHFLLKAAQKESKELSLRTPYLDSAVSRLSRRTSRGQRS